MNKKKWREGYIKLHKVRIHLMTRDSVFSKLKANRSKNTGIRHLDIVSNLTNEEKNDLDLVETNQYYLKFTTLLRFSLVLH